MFRYPPKFTMSAMILAVGLAANTGFAQSKTSAVGQSFTPTGRLVIYSTPENGLITRQRAKALVAPAPNQLTLYPLQQEGQNYVTGTPTQTPELKIEGVRDVVQGKTVSTWLKVSGAGQSGWIKYDPAITGPLSQYGF